MKKITLLFACVLISKFTYSQKLIDTGKVWNIMECFIPGACVTNTWEFKGNDTLLNNHTYKIIEQTDSLWGLYHSDQVFMREDSAKRVYAISTWGEVKMYDFNLQTGDTFRFDNSFFWQYYVVDNVDSVTLLSGEKRKRISFGAGAEQWIEGIGSSSGLFNVFLGAFVLDMSSSLLCFHENGIKKYEDPNFQNCFFSSVGIQENNSLVNFQISPNPTQTNCFINFNLPQTDLLKIQLLSNSGQILKSLAETNYLSGANIIELNVDDLAAGFYILKIQGQKHLANKKLLISGN